MTDESAFIAAILERPDDDLPRLIYADWLDEHDQPERAEFIRVQCQIAAWPIERCKTIAAGCAVADDTVIWHGERCPMKQTLRREHEMIDRLIWRGDALYLPIASERWRRGFIESVGCGWRDWIRFGVELMRSQPIAKVKLSRHSSNTPLTITFRPAESNDGKWRMSLWLGDDPAMAGEPPLNTGTFADRKTMVRDMIGLLTRSIYGQMPIAMPWGREISTGITP